MAQDHSAVSREGRKQIQFWLPSSQILEQKRPWLPRPVLPPSSQCNRATESSPSHKTTWSSGDCSISPGGSGGLSNEEPPPPNPTAASALGLHLQGCNDNNWWYLSVGISILYAFVHLILTILWGRDFFLFFVFFYFYSECWKDRPEGIITQKKWKKCWMFLWGKMLSFFPFSPLRDRKKIFTVNIYFCLFK